MAVVHSQIGGHARSRPISGHSASRLLRRLAAHGSMQALMLKSVSAIRHMFAGEANGRPLQLLLNFDENRVLRLQVAGDGWQMIVGGSQIDAPLDLGECGKTDIADVTQSLFPTLRAIEVTDVQGLTWHGGLVGVKLAAAGGDQFNFWADGDELHWGDEAALVSHDWLGGVAPAASERIEL